MRIVDNKFDATCIERIAQTSIPRVKKCLENNGRTSCTEVQAVSLTAALIAWWIDAFHGDGRMMFKLGDIVKPYNMTMDAALWCVSFFKDAL